MRKKETKQAPTVIAMSKEELDEELKREPRVKTDLRNWKSCDFSLDQSPPMRKKP